MTVEVVSGDIFKSTCEAITDANNSIGVSGAGLARAFAIRYPKITEHYNTYSKSYQEKMIDTYGKPALMIATLYRKEDYNVDYHIIKFPTMLYPGEVAKIENIKYNLHRVKYILKSNKIKSIALPALGCGIGRLPFEELEKAVREIFENDDITVQLYRPN